MTINDLECPNCGSNLKMKGNSVNCIKCNQEFPVISGIIDFYNKTDRFYEGKFDLENTRKKYFDKYPIATKLYLQISAFGFRNQHQKYYRKLPANSKVLDLGCGGGDPYLKNNNFRLIGIDISLSSLKIAKEIYDEVYRIAVPTLPFKSNSFDCVCSFDLIGHIPTVHKNELLKEISRVLKPGGLSFHYIEVDSKKGLANWAKTAPVLYHKYFLEQDGHFGLEHHNKILGRFRKFGFLLIDRKMFAKFIIPPIELAKRFNNEYKEKHWILKTMITFAYFISRNIWINAFLGFVLKPYQIIFEPLVPDDYGGLLYVAYENK